MNNIDWNNFEQEQELKKAKFNAVWGDDNLVKAMGHKYYKREPKAGGGYKYYYTKEQYNKAKGKKDDDKSEKKTTSKEGGKKTVKYEGKKLKYTDYKSKNIVGDIYEVDLFDDKKKIATIMVEEDQLKLL